MQNIQLYLHYPMNLQRNRGTVKTDTHRVVSLATGRRNVLTISIPSSNYWWLTNMVHIEDIYCTSKIESFKQ